MRAVRSHTPEGFEGIESLVYEDAPDPQPAIGDALVEVRAASFTPTELTWPLRTDRAGHERGPIIPAHEGSGVVVALGYGTAGLSPGDEVYGLIDGYRDGWAAEYVAIEARSLAPKPATVDFVEAAAIPQAGLTSWQALFDHGHLESGQTVVIHGAGSGVGAVGVQLARWAGAHVVGTARAARAVPPAARLPARSARPLATHTGRILAADLSRSVPSSQKPDTRSLADGGQRPGRSADGSGAFDEIPGVILVDRPLVVGHL
ncbi:MAG: alcohol dehydrogenase catalytic domain-containing protein [Trebonia sp.]